jgi:hypothetical protein
MKKILFIGLMALLVIINVTHLRGARARFDRIGRRLAHGDPTQHDLTRAVVKSSTSKYFHNLLVPTVAANMAIVVLLAVLHFTKEREPSITDGSAQHPPAA